MIFPVAVTLKRFLALEFVFTLGILPGVNFKPLRRSSQEDPCRTSSGNVAKTKFLQTGCKDKGARTKGQINMMVERPPLIEVSISDNIH